MEKLRTCTRCLINESFPGVTFDSEGVCSVCKENAEEQKKESYFDAEKKGRELRKLCEDAKAKKREFDVLVPLSGGKDSIYVLYYTVRILKLKTLAFTMDNGYLSNEAKGNIDRACKILGVEHLYYCLDFQMINELFSEFLRKSGYFCSVCMRNIGMTTEKIAGLYNVPLVFGGSSSRTELPLVPEMFQSGPSKYCKNVLKDTPYEKKYSRILSEGPWNRRLGYRLFWWGSQKRIRMCAWVNLPDYIEWNYDYIYKTIKGELGWHVSGEQEHSDCVIHPITEYFHNRRFKGSEIKRLTLSRLVQVGQMTRDEAEINLAEHKDEYPEEIFEMFLKNIKMTREEFDRIIDEGQKHLQFRPERGPVWKAISKIKKAVYSALGIRRT